MRFPGGVSLFHQFALNVKLLTSVRDALETLTHEQPDEPAIKLLALIVLYKNNYINRHGKSLTPLHVALEAKSPQAFNIMLEFLVDQTKVSVTHLLLDKLEEIVEMNSPVLLDFLN